MARVILCVRLKTSHIADHSHVDGQCDFVELATLARLATTHSHRTRRHNPT